jgi:hypothetical protein
MPGRGKLSLREDVPSTTLDEGLAPSAGSSSSDRPITPIGMNSQCSAVANDAFACEDTVKAFGSAADNAARAILLQLNTRLAFTP